MLMENPEPMRKSFKFRKHLRVILLSSALFCATTTLCSYPFAQLHHQRSRVPDAQKVRLAHTETQIIADQDYERTTNMPPGEIAVVEGRVFVFCSDSRRVYFVGQDIEDPGNTDSFYVVDVSQFCDRRYGRIPWSNRIGGNLTQIHPRLGETWDNIQSLLR